MRLASYWVPIMDQASLYFSQTQADPPDVVALRLSQQLDEAVQLAHQAGFSAEQVQDALYAVVAWLDEQAMSLPWEGAQAWRLAPLQKHYFSTTMAGLGFYQHLERLQVADAQVYEVYALALLAGFQGDYAHKPAADLHELRQQVLQQASTWVVKEPLNRAEPQLFPQLAQQKNSTAQVRSAPTLAVVLLIIVPLLILAGLYGYLDFVLGQDIQTLLQPFITGK